MIKLLSKILSGFVLASIMTVPVFATERDVETSSDFVGDQYDRGTPKKSFDGFVTAIDAVDYEAAAEYLDLRNLRGNATSLSGAQLARRLDVVLKRARWTDLYDLTDDPNGRRGDSLPEYRDSVGTIQHGSEQVQILI